MILGWNEATRFGVVLLSLVLLLPSAAAASEEAGGGANVGLMPTPVIRARPLQGLRADVAALILNGRVGGALWAAILAAPLPGVEGQGEVALWIELDGARLLDGLFDGTEAPSKRLKIEVHAYAMRASGGLAGSLSQFFRIQPSELAGVSQAGVKFSAGLDLPPGSYELRILVRETVSQRYGLRVLPLLVPAPEGDGILVGFPFFSDVPGAWTEVQGADGAPSLDGLPVPSALPVLSAGQPSMARIPIHGTVDGTSGGGRLRLSARLLDSERRGIRKVEAEWVEDEEGGAGGNAGFCLLEARFKLPDDLLTGNYFLETSVANRGRGASALKGEVRTTQIYVLGLERTEADVVWTDLRHLDALSSRRREALDLAAERRASKRLGAIAEAYRGVLEILVAGSVDEAGLELDQLETEVLEADSIEGRAWLGKAQDQVLAGLAKADPESLVPVLLLHMKQHEAYVRERRRALTFHARERVIVTARRYVASAESELAQALAAGALADMGVALARGHMKVAARRMMEEALALDEHNFDSILGLAVDHEQRGEPRQAVLYLRRLLTLEPNFEEGRLRLALNLHRSGDPAEAGRHLRRVLADVNSEWLLSLAYQQQAEILLAEQRVSLAAQGLEEAVRRLPSQRRLHLLLAYALDRLGEGGRAREVLRRIPAIKSGEMSPRLRYSRHFRGTTESNRPELLPQGLARLATLADALSESAKKKLNKKSGKKPPRKSRRSSRGQGSPK